MEHRAWKGIVRNVPSTALNDSSFSTSFEIFFCFLRVGDRVVVVGMLERGESDHVVMGKKNGWAGLDQEGSLLCGTLLSQGISGHRRDD